MATYLVVEGNAVYEVDQDCVKLKQNGHLSRSLRSFEADQNECISKKCCNRKTKNQR